jgi:carbonic anhydrase
LKEDVAFLRDSPFIQPGTWIVGLKYDIATGVVTKVDETKTGN